MFHAGAGGVANFVTTRGRREFRVCCEITKTKTMTKLTTDTDWTDLHRISYINEIKQMKQNSRLRDFKVRCTVGTMSLDWFS